MRWFLLTFCLVASLAAAQSRDPIDEFPGGVVRPPRRSMPKPTPKPTPPRPAPPAKTPVTKRPAPSPTGCVLALEVIQTNTDEGARLEGFVTNRSARPLTTRLQNLCPAPPMSFEGLPPGVFAFQTCTMGPCLSREPVVLTLAPGERRLLATGFVPWSGGPCSAPVTLQVFSVRGLLPFQGEAVATCDVPAPPPPKPVALPARSKCPQEACGVYCEFGQAKDANGCTTCGCNANPLMAPFQRP